MMVSITDLILSPAPVFFGPCAVDSRPHAAVDAKQPDVNRFNNTAQQSPRRLFNKRYGGGSIDAAIAVGTGTIEPVRCSWPGTRVVLAMVDEIDFMRSKLP
jgi:hypothetical protein